MLKKFFLITATLSMTLYSLPLYACDEQGDMAVEQASNKRRASNAPVYEGEITKKSKTDHGDSAPDTLMICEKNLLTSIVLGSFPQEIKNNIANFLNSSDLSSTALLCRSFHVAVRIAQMGNDSWALKDKKWLGGPVLNSFETYFDNYLFNSVVWKMSFSLIKKNQINLSDQGPFIKGAGFLGRYFCHIKHLDGLLEGFSNPSNYLISQNSLVLKNDAQNNPKSGEDDFLSLLTYASTNGTEYRLPSTLPPHPNLVERFHSAKLARLDLTKNTLTLKERLHAWDTLVRHTLDPIDPPEMIKEAFQLSLIGHMETDPVKKLATFERTGQLYEAVLLKKGDSVEMNDMRNAGISHFCVGKNVTNPAQKLASYKRSAQLFDAALRKTDRRAERQDINNAAIAHFSVWQNATNPAQKKASCERAAQLYDTVLLQMDKKTKTQDIKDAASVHFYLGQNATDSEQKRASYERAAQLYDALLLSMGEKAGVEDIRNTATAHFYVGKRSANTTQKFASYIRAADLFNDLSVRLKGQSSKSEIDRVKLIHTYIAQNTTDLEVKIKSLERVQALRDQHEVFFDTQAYSFDL